MTKAHDHCQVDLDAGDLFYAYQTYEFCAHIADAEGMIYDTTSIPS